MLETRPYVRILLRADSGFARETLTAWCKDNCVDYAFGLARNTRLVAVIDPELAAAKAMVEQTSRPARRFKDFQWSTLDSWSRRRRVALVRISIRRIRIAMISACPAAEDWGRAARRLATAHHPPGRAPPQRVTTRHSPIAAREPRPMPTVLSVYRATMPHGLPRQVFQLRIHASVV